MTKRQDVILTIKLILIIYLILFGLYSFASYQYDKKKFLSNIPIGLETKKTLGVKYTISIIGDCGKGAFELDKSVVKKIDEAGLAYLNSEIKDQYGGINTNNKLQWSKGPYPHSWYSEGIISCDYGTLYWPIYFINEDIERKVQLAQLANDFYYARGGYAEGYIFVIYPKARLLSVWAQIQ